ncbi:hypothetical protein [Saccharospirillum mangrovi]|uniref:hypothetical protein n=1 Tax=Saccharospirillum mangrovi TaxID=2161747 RepID=UPI001E3AA5E3|nr:hypothetical protein [Saccharospirillum mangrovi]
MSRILLSLNLATSLLLCADPAWAYGYQPGDFAHRPSLVTRHPTQYTHQRRFYGHSQ